MQNIADAHPKHLPEVRVSEAEGDVRDVESFGGAFSLQSINPPRATAATRAVTHSLGRGCSIRLLHEDDATVSVKLKQNL